MSESEESGRMWCCPIHHHVADLPFLPHKPRPPKAPILVVPFEDVEIATILPYKLVSIPGKGKGLVASRPISAGECLFNEEPLLALDSDEERRGDLFQARYEAMDDDKRKRYESLCDKSRNQATPKGIWEVRESV